MTVCIGTDAVTISPALWSSSLCRSVRTDRIATRPIGRPAIIFGIQPASSTPRRTSSPAACSASALATVAASAAATAIQPPRHESASADKSGPDLGSGTSAELSCSAKSRRWTSCRCPMVSVGVACSSFTPLASKLSRVTAAPRLRSRSASHSAAAWPPGVPIRRPSYWSEASSWTVASMASAEAPPRTAAASAASGRGDALVIRSTRQRSPSRRPARIRSTNWRRPRCPCRSNLRSSQQTSPGASAAAARRRRCERLCGVADEPAKECFGSHDRVLRVERSVEPLS